MPGSTCHIISKLQGLQNSHSSIQFIAIYLFSVQGYKDSDTALPINTFIHTASNI